MKRMLVGFFILVLMLGVLLINVSQGRAGEVLLARLVVQDRSDLDSLADLELEVVNFRHPQVGGAPLYILANQAQLAAVTEAGFSVELIPGYLEGSTLYAFEIEAGRGVQLLTEIYPEAVVLVSEGEVALLMLPEAFSQEQQQVSGRFKILEPMPFYAPEALSAVINSGEVASETIVVYDPRIQAMIFGVERDPLANLIAGLSGENPVTINGNPYTILTRYSYAGIPINKATAYTEEYLRNLGLETDFEYYEPFVGTEWRNVIAEQPGLTQPQKIILLTAHIDSRSEIPMSYAPGADDNATGTAGLLIAANVLSQYPFEYTIRYVLFTGEEQGHYGSLDYAAQQRALGANIRAVINLDMIGYNSDASPVYEMHIRPSSIYPEDWEIATTLRDVVNIYSLGLTTQIVQDSWWISDHDSFWDYGYPAVWVFEDYENFNPYYHTTNDQIESVNKPYVRDIVRAAVGAAAHLAGVVDLKPTFLPGTWLAFIAGAPPQP